MMTELSFQNARMPGIRAVDGFAGGKSIGLDEIFIHFYVSGTQ